MELPINSNGSHKMLIDFRKISTHRIRGKAEQIDHHHASRRCCEVPAISVVADVVFEAFVSTEAELSCFCWRYDKAGSMQFNAWRA